MHTRARDRVQGRAGQRAEESREIDEGALHFAPEEVASPDARRDADEVGGRPGYVAGPWGSSTSRLHARGDVAAKSSRSEVDWSADWGRDAHPPGEGCTPAGEGMKTGHPRN